MNIQETILKTHADLIANTPLAGDDAYVIKADDIKVMTRVALVVNYPKLLEDDFNSAFVNLLVRSIRAYGEAKWNEAVEATRNSICSDQSTPPKFIE